MTSGIAADLITGLLPLLGAGLGASATVVVQRSSTTATRMQYAAQVRTVRRDQVKTAVISYFEHAQRLQGQLDARERGDSPNDVKQLIEKVWLAEKQVEIIASDDLRDRLIAHARGLHDVVRDETIFPDWWAHCAHLQDVLLAQIKQDLTPFERLSFRLSRRQSLRSGVPRRHLSTLKGGIVSDGCACGRCDVFDVRLSRDQANDDVIPTGNGPATDSRPRLLLANAS
jgi:hypothetical protein